MYKMPKGLMCCICFNLDPPGVVGEPDENGIFVAETVEFWVDEDGVTWDVCVGCHAMENIPSQTWPC